MTRGDWLNGVPLIAGLIAAVLLAAIIFIYGR